MPSTNTNWRLGALVLAALVLTYAIVVANNVLVGVFVAALVYLLAWVIDRASAGSPLDDMSRERQAVTGGLVLVILAYSLVIVASLLLGVLAAATVCVVSWVTSPIGPVARWLDRR
ncbi:hypothetical protein [Haloplanus sp. C73]|uniref:hypothetical protein n=1 Tax=Haloplanus sp. C73 TaxID=3421641 RepID=UPI003EBA5900